MLTKRLLPLLLALLASCYQPAPPNGALLCSTDGQCPDGYHCASDGTCWQAGEDPGGAPDAAVPFTQAPAAISPRNGASTGTVYAALSRRPVFRWRAVPDAISYEIQVDDSCDAAAFRSCAFPSPEATETTSMTSLRLSTGLTVSMSVPVGRRYYWRVRGCADPRCTPWSEAHYLDVGRIPTDYNGDGHSDLAIGNAEVAFNGVPRVGMTYVIPGVMKFLGFDRLTPPGPASGDNYGIALASAGDVDGDGYVDLAVASQIADQSGRVYLYRGGTSWPTSAPTQTLPNPEGQAEASFGHALAGGDLNGDGHSDLAVGAEIQDGAVPSDGKVFIYHGESSAKGLPAAPSRTLENPSRQEQGYFGNALAIGDFDGDGYPDLAVGARKQGAVGRVFVYRGGPDSVSALPSAALDSPVIFTGAGFGTSLAAGDFDGDGYADLAVGAPLEGSETAAVVGHVYVFHGGTGGILDRAAPWRSLDNPTGEMYASFGSALVAADFNADGSDDLAVAAVGLDTQVGRVHVYSGAAAGLPAMPSRTLTDPPATGFGHVLATGDREPADGFVDLFVGAVYSGGTIYLFDGSAGGLPTMTGNVITNQFLPGANLGPSSLSSAPP